MLLGRLRVRQKLVLLVVPLLLLATAGAVPLVFSRVRAAERSADSAGTVQRAVRVGELVQELQQERLDSLGYLTDVVPRDRLVARSGRVLELAAQLDAAYGAADGQLRSALRGTGARSVLVGIRARVLAKQATGIAVYTDFTGAIDALIDVLGLLEHADRTTAVGRLQLALDALVHSEEATAAAAAALFIEPGLKVTPRVVALVGAGQALHSREESTFIRLALPDAVRLYGQLQGGPSSTRVGAYLTSVTASADGLLQEPVGTALLQQVQSLTSQSRTVDSRVAAEALDQADRSANRGRSLAGFGFGIALLLLIGAGLLSVLITRSIARPLRRLTASADEVADVAQRELVRVADTDDPEEAVPQLRPVQVGTADEMGELAQAFNRVQQVASSLVERQLVSRQNVATMFGNVGRRTQNLVGRQLAMIDSLERNEQDPALLDRLYRLDHVSTRLRRNANSLVVLSGATDQQISGEPLTVADTIRSALGEIEGFQRVRLGEVDSALLTPNVTPDVILLLAELLENGTSFSPPHTEVEVDAQAFAGGGVIIRIVDHGLGMTTEQLAAENGRLVSRERLDLAPTDVLGLFVVGRLARRHGIEVLLAPTPGTGVTAEVRVPAQHVVRSEAAVAEPAVARPAAVPVSAPAEEGDGRGWWDGTEPRSAPAVDPGTSLFRSGGRRAAPVEPAAGSAPAVDEVAAPAEVAPESAPTPSSADIVATPEPAEVRESDARPTGVDGRTDKSDGRADESDGRVAAAAAEVGAGRVEGPVGAEDLPVASEAEVARNVPRPRGATGMVRRVRGAQHPDTGAPRRPEPPVLAAPASADDARQEIEDFEEGVRRARRETGADGGAGFVVDADETVAPWTDLDPDDPQSAAQTQARVEEFEDGVRRALARLDEVAVRPAAPAPLFEATNGVVPAPRPSPEPSAPPTLPDPAAANAAGADAARTDAAGTDVAGTDVAGTDVAGTDVAGTDVAGTDVAGTEVAGTDAGGTEPAKGALPRRRPTEGVPLVPRRLDAGAGATRSEPPGRGRGRPDPRPLERRRPPEPGPAGSRANETSPNGRTGTPSDAGKLDSAGDDDLVRRVPGAQMPAGARGTRPEPPAQQNGAAHDGTEHDGTEHDGKEHDGAEHDPAEQHASAARSLVEEFEAGVQRALQLGGDRGTAGTAETDEEDAR